MTEFKPVVSSEIGSDRYVHCAPQKLPSYATAVNIKRFVSKSHLEITKSVSSIGLVNAS